MTFNNRVAAIAAVVTLAACGEREPEGAVGRATIDTTNVTAIDGCPPSSSSAGPSR